MRSQLGGSCQRPGYALGIGPRSIYRLSAKMATLRTTVETLIGAMAHTAEGHPRSLHPDFNCHRARWESDVHYAVPLGECARSGLLKDHVGVPGIPAILEGAVKAAEPQGIEAIAGAHCSRDLKMPGRRFDDRPGRAVDEFG